MADCPLRWVRGKRVTNLAGWKKSGPTLPLLLPLGGAQNLMFPLRNRGAITEPRVRDLSQPCSGPSPFCDRGQMTSQILCDATIKWDENVKSIYLSGSLLNLGSVDLHGLCISSWRPIGSPPSFFFLILITSNDFHKLNLAYPRATLYGILG